MWSNNSERFISIYHISRITLKPGYFLYYMTISVFANVENAYLLIIWQRTDRRGGALNHEEVLVVLPDSREEAKSIKEIAQAMGLEISS